MGKPLLSLFRSTSDVLTAGIACAILLCGVPFAEASDLYTADVAVTANNLNARRAAYAEAIEVVLARVAVDSMSDARTRELFPDPANFVVRFQPLEQELLRVTFDGEAIERVLTRSGESFWGDDRPTTLIWLAVDWGDGQRELLASGDATESTELLEPDAAVLRSQQLRKQIREVADRRGIPVLFPLVDADDLREASFADVWGGFDSAVMAASRRYAVDSVLMGRVQGNRLQSARWTHVFGGESMTVAGRPELALGSIADRLASVFSIGGRDTLREIRLHVGGMTSMEAYAQLVTILDDISLIERHAITSMNGDRIEFSVTAHGGAPRLARALTVKGLLPEAQDSVESTRRRPEQGAPVERSPAALNELHFYLDL